MSDHLLFVGLDTGTIDDAGQGVVVDLDEVDYIPDGDDFVDDIHLMAIGSAHGVPVADLVEAYRRERRVIASIGCVFDVDDDGHVRARPVAR